MLAWLYRYVFRGIGIVFLVGVVTILILAISSQRERMQGMPTSPGTSATPKTSDEPASRARP